MEKFLIDSENIDKNIITHVAKILKSGGVGIVPTDTVYGLAADAYIKPAVEKIYKIKGRDRNKPIAIAINKIEDLEKFVKEIPPVGYQLIETFFPGPLTLIFLAKENVLEHIVNKTIAIRMPNNEIISSIIEELKEPLALTSANKSGEKSCYRIEDINLEGVDFIIDSGETELKIESTILDISTPKPSLIREGAIPKERLLEFIEL
jgi:L-threonylcarbamoyladenylate synthase